MSIYNVIILSITSVTSIKTLKSTPTFYPYLQWGSAFVVSYGTTLYGTNRD